MIAVDGLLISEVPESKLMMSMTKMILWTFLPHQSSVVMNNLKKMNIESIRLVAKMIEAVTVFQAVPMMWYKWLLVKILDMVTVDESRMAYDQ